MITDSPRAVALRILDARYQYAAAGRSDVYQLADFQEQAIARACQIIKWRGGVIVADSVGLGKTFIAAGLIERHPDLEIAVAVPAATLAMWRRTLRPLRHERLHLITHGQLSRGHTPQGCALVVADEAHAFRNPHTRRYQALRGLCRRARVVLLTATPVNNSLSDLYFQLRLWCADNAFRDLGIGSLASLLTAPDPDRDALDRLRRAIIIRRTRADVERTSAEIALPNGQRLCFPRSKSLVNVHYHPMLPMDYVGSVLARIEFAAHAQHVVTPILLRLSLLKRMQSSTHAVLISLDRLIAFNDRFLQTLSAGRLLRGAACVGDQLFFTEIVLEEIPLGVDVASLEIRVRNDLAALRQLRGRIADTTDDKLCRLQRLLQQRGERRTIVFSEFSDTAEHLWRRLAPRCRAGLVTGNSGYLGNDRCSRAGVIRSFAPVANGAAPPPAHQTVHTLFTTDVLAEGLNLQDADAVVSYDLPWNPVRLIQRAGRIDRLGSPHDAIIVYNFLPDREFDLFLGLVRRLRGKLRSARQVVRQESAVLEPEELDADFVAALSSADHSILDLPNDAHGLRAAWESGQADASTPGAVAALAGPVNRVLVSLERNGVLRELIVYASHIVEDPVAADCALREALAIDAVRPCAAESSIRRAIDYLTASEVAAGGQADDVLRLAAAVRKSIQQLGLLGTAELVEQADRVLALLPGYIGNARADRTRLLGATARDLPAALARIELACSLPLQQSASPWRLMGAIAAD